MASQKPHPSHAQMVQWASAAPAEHQSTHSGSCPDAQAPLDLSADPGLAAAPAGVAAGAAAAGVAADAALLSFSLWAATWHTRSMHDMCRHMKCIAGVADDGRSRPQPAATALTELTVQTIFQWL